jgi:hypothetical protein
LPLRSRIVRILRRCRLGSLRMANGRRHEKDCQPRGHRLES